MRTRNDFGALVERYRQTGWGAEIGVQTGANAARIIKAWRGGMILVDPWRVLEGYENRNNDAKLHALYYRQARGRLEPYGERCRWMRMTSAEAAPQIEDGSLDWVYIDADHTYEAVKEDLVLWYPKARPGGIVAGHDYMDGGPEDGLFGPYGVKSAVDEFAASQGLEINVTTDDVWSDGINYPTWWAVKP